MLHGLRSASTPQSEDGLVHVEWFERTDAGANPVPEVDVILFSEEAHFERVGAADAPRPLPAPPRARPP